MPRYSTAFGMDVHLRSTTVCALDAETGEAVTRRFRGNPWGEVAEWMSGFPGPSLAAYESGYLGFAPQRELSGLGVDCVVAAVSRVPRSAADLSSKNDRNDAARMAKAILSHDISPVWVPSPEIEGLRDLAGAHDAATARLAAAKQRLLAFLARRGYAYGGTTPAGNPRRYWTYGFLRWLDKVRPADDGGIRALAALRSEVEAAAETRDDLLAEYRAAVAAGPLSAEVEALQSIKGCGFALAAAFASEVGDFSRFRSGRQVTSYFGLAPKQRSSADSVRLGGISGAGNALVRRLAVEGSWSYVQASHQPKLMPKGSGVPLEVRMHGRKGSERLLRRREVDWQHLFGRFREGQPRLPELDRRHVAQRRVDPEVVVPVHVVRELGPELARRAERLAVDELGLQYPVGRLVDGVVVGAALGVSATVKTTNFAIAL